MILCKRIAESLLLSILLKLGGDENEMCYNDITKRELKAVILATQFVMD